MGEAISQGISNFCLNTWLKKNLKLDLEFFEIKKKIIGVEKS
jgi:hypothetical protein